jgi:hypothetical protein
MTTEFDDLSSTEEIARSKSLIEGRALLNQSRCANPQRDSAKLKAAQSVTPSPLTSPNPLPHLF